VAVIVISSPSAISAFCPLKFIVGIQGFVVDSVIAPVVLIKFPKSHDTSDNNNKMPQNSFNLHLFNFFLLRASQD
jgi:hypothetical protein